VTDLFQEHMRLDEQHDKRYLRLLQSLADEALRAPEAPLGTRLGGGEAAGVGSDATPNPSLEPKPNPVPMATKSGRAT